MDLSKHDRNIMICSLHEKGFTYTEIAQKFNISRAQVGRIVNRPDIGGSYAEEPTLDEVKQKILEGNTLTDLEKIFGVSEDVIRKKINQIDFQERKKLLRASTVARRKKDLQVKKEYWSKFNPLGCWTLLDLHLNGNNQIIADCECVCGEQAKVQFASIITRGTSLSCGCQRRNPLRHSWKKTILDLAESAP